MSEAGTAGIAASTPVLIVGGGPVGLSLAAELGRMGVACMLVEKRDGAVHVPKMSQVSARGMEFCRRWGIASAVRKAVWSENYPLDFVYMESLAGAELGRHGISSYAARGRQDLSPEGACHCPQIYFDPILAAHVRTLPGVTVRYNVGLEAFAQTADAVRVRLSDSLSGRSETVEARFLVGCDGAAGAVRAGLGIRLGGEGVVANSVNIFFRSPELHALHDKGWARFYRAIDETGCWSELIPIDGRELWRLTVFDESGVERAPEHYLRHMAGRDFPYEIISAGRWERRDYVADSYGRGRVFIAGDAAHQCSPTGGLGMHTGMEEAVNLAWKLAASLQGWAGPELLPSYEAERRPVALRNVAMATAAFRTIAAIPGLGEAATVAAYLRERMQTFSVSDQAKLDYAYPGSPVCAAPDDAAGDAVWAGRRAPHAWLDDGRSLLDLFGTGLTLLSFGAATDADDDARALAAAAARRGMPLAVQPVAAAEARAKYPARLVLVRADGHVAWTGDRAPADPLALIDRLRGAAAAGGPAAGPA